MLGLKSNHVCWYTLCGWNMQKAEGAIGRIELYGRWGNKVTLAEDPVNAIRELLKKKG